MATTTTHYGWIQPTLGGDPTTWGSELNSDLGLIDGQVYANQTAIATINAQLGPPLVLNKSTVAAGNPIYGNSATVPRWVMQLGDGVAETGSNAGSNFAIYRYSDSGTYIDTPFSIVRATGAASFSGSVAAASLSCSGNISCNAITTTGSGSALSATTVNATTVTATGLISGGNLTASNGFVNVVRGTAQNPTIFLNDNSVNRSAFYYDTPSGQTIVQDLTSGASLTLDGVANFHYNGTGNAYKPGGGSWSAPSDARIKTVVGDYASGLDRVTQLRPVIYTYKGNDAAPGAASPTRQRDRQFVGFVAQDLEKVMPEMVTQRQGYVDGQRVTDLRDVDVSSLVFALVNCVRELKAEIDALKAARA